MTDTPRPPHPENALERPVVVSSPDLLGSARLVRALQYLLEALVGLIVVGSVAAFGAVHQPSYTVLWVATFLAFAVMLARALAVESLRQRLGHHHVAFHVSGRWLILEPDHDHYAVGWSLDLREPALPKAPLLLPALAFLALAVAQLVPLPGLGVVSVAAEDTRRGITFVLSALLLHEAAAAAFAKPAARQRFRRGLAWLAAVLAVFALAQLASGTRLVYGWFQPHEGDGRSIFGPFVNRNHFAGYLLLLIPMTLGLLAGAWRRYARRVGTQPNLRRRIVGLASPEGTRLLYASVPPLLAIGSLLATTSRGGILAFAGASVLALAGLRSKRGMSGWAAAAVFTAMALSWYGIERLELRFWRADDDAPGRTQVWQESLRTLHGSRWLTGYGFNTFGTAFSRVPAWTLPIGATPWPEGTEEVLASPARVGYRSPADLPGLGWYREAHNDWLQLLVEAGLPGLLIGLWAAGAVLYVARGEPWRFAALAGVLMHALVDFDLQIPAIPVLFVVLAALPARRARGET